MLRLLSLKMASHIRQDMIKDVKIPIRIFEFSKLSPFENVVYYLSEKLYLKDCEIAFLLKRDPRTIWTVKIRALRKANKLKIAQPKDFIKFDKRVKVLA